MSKRILGTTCICAFLVVAAGCSTKQTVRNDSDEPLTYQALAKTYLKDGKPAYDKEDLLETLRAAKAFHDAGLWELSTEAFDAAYEKLSWKEDTVDTPEEVSTLLWTTLTSSAFGPYQGKIFEGGLNDYYQALNSLMLGDEARARVQFNRLEVRQQNALDQLKTFALTIQDTSTKAIAQNQEKNAEKTFEQIQEKTMAGLKSIPEGLEDAYIRNAAGDILSAVFRTTSSARQDKSVSLVAHTLKAAADSVPSLPARELVEHLRNDIERNQARLRGKVFLIFEDGRGPGFEEFRIDLPLFLVTDKVLYSGVALPAFVRGEETLGHLTIANTGTHTTVVTDVNNLAALEFKKAYPGIVAKAVISAIIKTAAQYAANEQADRKMGGVGSMLVKTATAATQYHLTRADVRAWDNLPNTIQMAILDRPPDGRLVFADPQGRTLAETSLPPAENVLVLVRISPDVARPAIYTAALGRR